MELVTVRSGPKIDKVLFYVNIVTANALATTTKEYLLPFELL